MTEENTEQPKKKRQRKSKVKMIADTIEKIETAYEEVAPTTLDSLPTETGGTVKKIGTVARYIADTGIYEFSRMYKKIKHATANRSKAISGGFVVTILPSDEEGRPTSNIPLATFKNISVEEAFAKIGYELK